ncbi:MAG: hypothetical protein KatS3mg110_1818 [Pirellulaceae bacterium]|nr:MAG: hypothetical protein KatS3mg110_1818 [Pirellulaceae bacterium]
MPDRPAYWKLWLTVGLTAFALRAAAAVWWQSRLGADRLFFFPDSDTYWQLAKSLACGGPFQLGPDAQVVRTPAYPLLLAGTIYVFGDGSPGVVAARLLGAGLGAVTALLAGWWAGCLSNAGRDRQRIGLLAAALVCFYPGAIATSIFVLSEALFCPLMVAQLACWSWCHYRPSSSLSRLIGSSAVGGLGALATLCRPSWLLFTPVAAVAWLGFGPRPASRVGAAGALLLGFTLVMLPWWVRNYAVTGHWVPTTLQVGASLYDGLNPHATGASNMDFVPRFWDEERQRRQSRPSAVPLEVAVDRKMFQAAVAWARTHPVEVARLAVRKFIRMWSPWPNDRQLQQSYAAWILAASYIFLLFPAVLGITRQWSAGWPVVLAVLPTIYLTALHVVFVGSVRYREPAMLGWCVLAALGVWHLVRVRSSGDRP